MNLLRQAGWILLQQAFTVAGVMAACLMAVGALGITMGAALCALWDLIEERGRGH